MTYEQMRREYDRSTIESLNRREAAQRLRMLRIRGGVIVLAGSPVLATVLARAFS